MNKNLKNKISILVLCTGNSCRSQMAEGFLKKYKKEWDIESAGITPVELNPMSVKVMAEKGIDISSQKSKSVGKFLDRNFDYIITVCNNARESCPLFPGKAKYIHWDIEDPSFVDGSYEFKLKKNLEKQEIRLKSIYWIF